MNRTYVGLGISVAIDPNRTWATYSVGLPKASFGGIGFTDNVCGRGGQGAVMIRREFITLLGGTAVAWPRVARTQPASVPVIGFLSSRSSNESAQVMSAFRKGLGETGYVDGRNVKIEYRWAEGEYKRLPKLAAELIQQSVTVIATGGGVVSALAAKAATDTIPVVFAGVSDPVGMGLVASLSKPGGNITGASHFSSELAAKRLALLHELIPNGRVIAALHNPKFPNALELSDLQAATSALALQLRTLNASILGDIDRVFATLAEQKVDALVVISDPFIDGQREKIVQLVALRSLPAIYSFREFVEVGGIMSYGTNLAETYSKAGNYVGRVLHGEKPIDLPVVQPTKFELILNLKTAKTLGLDIPARLLATADEVIE